MLRRVAVPLLVSLVTMAGTGRVAAIEGIVRVAGTDRPAAWIVVHVLDLGKAENRVETD